MESTNRGNGSVENISCDRVYHVDSHMTVSKDTYVFIYSGLTQGVIFTPYQPIVDKLTDKVSHSSGSNQWPL